MDEQQTTVQEDYRFLAFGKETKVNAEPTIWKEDLGEGFRKKEEYATYGLNFVGWFLVFFPAQ